MSDKISDILYSRFEFHNYNNALEILAYAYPDEWKDITDALDHFVLFESDLSVAGGSETNIPSKFDAVFFSRDWKNYLVNASLNVKFFERFAEMKQYEKDPSLVKVIPDYLTAQVDYQKGRVAVYLEWNKKDLAFDKTLSDIRHLYECGIIGAAVIITRGEDLNDAFREIKDSDGKPIIRKYGTTSTWIAKLLPRLNSRAAAGCPVLAIGIKRACIEGC